MPASVLTALGLHIYRVPDFHKRALLVVDAASVLLRAGLDPEEEDRLLNQAMDALVLSPAPAIDSP